MKRKKLKEIQVYKKESRKNLLKTNIKYLLMNMMKLKEAEDLDK